MRSLLLCCVLSLVAVPAWCAEKPIANAVEQQLGTAVEIQGQPATKRALADAMRDLHVPGVSVAVIRDGRIAWTHAYGATIDTPFQAGSISKSIAALAILDLAASGKVSLDTPVNDALKSWKLPDSDAGKASEVTLRRLLAHVAGTNVHGFNGYARDAAVPSLHAILDGKPPANTPAIRITSAPGATWKYSGGGYVIAQQLVEDVTKQSFADYTARWMRDANMQHSRFAAPAKEVKVAFGHTADGTEVQGGYHLYPEAAAAGLWTTPTDLARALLAMSKTSKQIVLQPIVPGHAVGFDTNGAWISKGGDTEGFAGFLVYYPGRGDGAIVLTNGAQGSTLARDVVRAIAIEEHWPDFGPRIRKSETIPQALLESLPGTYVYRDTNHFTIARIEDKLTIVSPGEQPEAFHRDSNGEFFTLSQDVAFVFDANPATGQIRIGDNVIAFKKDK